MVTIKLTSDDRDVLIGILDEYFSELRNEISNTENWEFKEHLKTEEALLNRLLGEMRTDKFMEQEKASTSKSSL
jgi:hypothetical protein